MIKEIKIKNIKELHTTNMNGEAEVEFNALLDNDLTLEQATDLARSKKIKIYYEVTDEIIDLEEKEYLSAVIRPFRDRIDSISKESMPFGDNCFIAISLDDGEDEIFLPVFEKDEMYLGMEIGREYTLEELDL